MWLSLVSLSVIGGTLLVRNGVVSGVMARYLRARLGGTRRLFPYGRLAEVPCFVRVSRRVTGTLD